MKRYTNIWFCHIFTQMRERYTFSVSHTFNAKVMQRVFYTSKRVYVYVNYLPLMLGMSIMIAFALFFFFLTELIRDLQLYHLDGIILFFNRISLGTTLHLILSSIPYTALFFMLIDGLMIFFLLKQAYKIMTTYAKPNL